MILSTHALGGAAAALLLARDPAAAFAAGFFSHILLDMIPHWHYHLRSRERSGNDRMSERLRILDRRFLRDLAVMGAECIGGFAVALAAARLGGKDLEFIWWAAVGGVLPDFLQFLYHLYPRTPFLELQRAHKWIHAKINLDDRPLLGIGSQAALALLFIWLILA